MMCFGKATISSSEKLSRLASDREYGSSSLVSFGDAFFRRSRFLSSVEVLLGALVDSRFLRRLVQSAVLLPTFCDELLDLLGGEC